MPVEPFNINPNTPSQTRDTFFRIKQNGLSLQAEIDAAEDDIDALELRMDTAEDDIDALELRMDTAEDDIDALELRMDDAETDILALELRMDDAEGDIDALETRMDTAEADIDALEAAVSPLSFSANAASNVAAGDALYAPSTGDVAPAQADALTTSYVVGFAINMATTGQVVNVRPVGIITVTGVAVGLPYYLSADTPGAVVSTPDAVAGEYLVAVGIATDDDELGINISYPIGL